MKNTKKSGILHFRIFKWNGRYFGICKETGYVEESKDFDLVLDKLIKGTTAILKAVITSQENLEASLNTSLPFKYHIYYHLAPILGLLEFIRESKVGGFYSFTRPISTLRVNG